MLDLIVKLINHGTTVEHAYKVGIEDWVDQVKVHRHLGYNETGELETQYWVQSPFSSFQAYATPEEAATIFCSLAYSKHNLANAYRGLVKRKLVNCDWESKPSAETNRLIELYQTQYHAEDFPFADQFSDEFIKQEMHWSEESRKQNLSTNFVDEDEGPRFES